MVNQIKFLWTAYIKWSRLTTSWMSFEVTEDVYSKTYRNFDSPQTLLVTNDDETIAEFMIATHNDWVVTIEIRWLNDARESVPEYKREWLAGAKVKLVAGPWDYIDADSGELLLPGHVAFEKSVKFPRYDDIAAVNIAIPDPEIGMKVTLDDWLDYTYNWSDWVAMASGATPFASHSAAWKGKTANADDMIAKSATDGAWSPYFVTPDLFKDERTLDWSGNPENAWLPISANEDWYVPPSMLWSVTEFTDGLYMKYWDLEIKTESYTINVDDSIVEYNWAWSHTFTLCAAWDYSFSVVKRYLIIKNRSGHDLIVAWVIDGITDLTLKAWRSIILYSNGSNRYSATMTPIQYMTPEEIIEEVQNRPGKIIAGNTYTASSHSWGSISWPSYTKKFEGTIVRAWTYRVAFTLQSPSLSVAYARVYKNDIAFWTEVEANNTTVWYSQDLTFAAWDVVSVYCRTLYWTGSITLYTVKYDMSFWQYTFATT